MKLSPISFNLNNQIRNNKIQNQPRLNPMTSDCVSFGANIPKSVFQEVSNNALLGLLDFGEYHNTDRLENFFKLDSETITNILKEADKETRKTFCVNQEALSLALANNKVQTILQTAKNDSELMELLNCTCVDERSYDCYFRGPLKMMLPVSDFISVLEKLYKTTNKKQILLGQHTHELTVYSRWVKCTDTYARKMNYIFSSRDFQRYCSEFSKKPTPEEQKRLGNIILEVIQDEETTNEEAMELISLYKNFYTGYGELCFQELEKYLKSQIEE